MQFIFSSVLILFLSSEFIFKRMKKKDNDDKNINDYTYHKNITGYQKYLLNPYKNHVQMPNVLKMIGDVKGLNIVETACGEGIYTRKLIELGAQKIVGLDYSTELIKQAQEMERQNPSGKIKYIVQDCSKSFKYVQNEFSNNQKIDLFFMGFVVNYSKNREQMVGFIKSAYEVLEKGGRIVGYLENPFLKPGKYVWKIGDQFKKTFEIGKDGKEMEDYDTFIAEINADNIIHHENYTYLKPETFKQAVLDAGFRNFKWMHAEVLNEVTKQYKQDSIIPGDKFEFSIAGWEAFK